jgi:hypothetical protein
MSVCLHALTLAALVLGLPDPIDLAPSYLLHQEGGDAERFVAQEGDIVLFDHHCRWMNLMYQCAGSGGPLHAALVFKRPDGAPALIEAGPMFVQRVLVWEINPRLHTFDGTILVRRLQTPLSAEQSQALTEFCTAQEGKSYALGRVLLQGTLLRARGPLRTHYLGKTILDRDRWLCSELVVAAMTVAGVLNDTEHPANTFYPRDLCFDDSRHDLSRHYRRPARWSTRPDLELTGETNARDAPRNR